jgi:putative ABC transport system permease protein
MLRTTLRNLRARPLRVLGTSLAVLLGVAFMAGTLVLTDTMGRSFDQLVEQVYADTDAVVRGEQQFAASNPWGTPGRALLDEGLIDVVAEVEGVDAVYATIEGYAQLVGADGDPVGNPAMGPPTLGMVWTDDPRFNPMRLREGRAPEQGDEVVIDANGAEVGGLEVGDTTSILTAAGPLPVTIVGIAGWVDADSPLGASITAMLPDYAQLAVGLPGKVNLIQVAGDGSVGQSELRDRLLAAMPDGVEVLTGDEITAEEQGSIRDLMAFFGTFMLTFALVALFVGSFIIYNTFSILVAQRNREMALMRAIGAARRQVLGSLLIEAGVIGLISATVGLVAGLGVAGLLKGLLDAFGMNVPAGGLVVTRGTIVVSFLVGLAVTIGAAVVPARKASRIPPIAAMSDVPVGVTTSIRRRSIVGGAVTVAGVALLSVGLFGDTDDGVLLVGAGAAILFLGIAALGPLLVGPAARLLGAPVRRLSGVPGALARENALRNPKRTASTASALMVGVALVSLITIFAASARASIDTIIDQTFRGDFIVDSGTFGVGGFDPGLAARIGELPEVSAASGARIGEALVEGDVQYLFAVDPTTIAEIFDAGIVAGDLESLDSSSIGVWDERADEEGWSIGDTITVQFPETGAHDFTIGVLFEHRELVGTSFVLSTEAFDLHLPTVLDMSVFVAAAPGVDPEVARAAIEVAAADYATASVLDQTEYKEMQAASFDQILGLVYVLLLLAVLIALLGIANTLALSIFERTRELGLLRAVGMTRRQLRTTVRWESVIIALFGSLLGLAIGVFLGWALVRALASEGFGTLVLPGPALLVIVVLGAVAGVVAAVVPARRAGRIDVLQALASV